MSGGESVLCWLTAPVAMSCVNLSKFGNKNKTNHPISSNSDGERRPQNIAIHCLKRGGRVKISNKVSSVISSQISVMSDQLRVSLYGHVPECYVREGQGRGRLYNV